MKWNYQLLNILLGKDKNNLKFIFSFSFFKKTRYIQQIQKWFTLTSKISSKADVFSVKINMTVRMKENNVNAPYIFSEVI